MDARQRAWLINLDAEREVEAWSPDRAGGGEDLFRALESRPEVLRSLAPLIGDDVLLVRAEQRDLRGTRGFAWCMTAAARAALERAGAEVGVGPSMELLQRCMSRAFAQRVGLGLRSWFVTRADDLRIEGEGPWLLRTAYGFAGRGRCVAERWPPEEPSVLGFVRRAVRRGGLLVSPLVKPTADFAQHGYVSARGLVLGEPTTLEVGAGGVWRSSRRASADDLGAHERAALLERARCAGVMLAEAGYVGPYGVDAFRYADGFSSLCEINVRYTMGWAIGMGARRPDWDGP